MNWEITTFIAYFVILLGVALVFYFWLHLTSNGRKIFAIGTLLQFNPDVSAYLLAEFRFQKMLSDIFKILADVADIDLDSLTRS